MNQRRLSILGTLLVLSLPSYGQSADEIFEGCRHVKMEECRQLFAGSESASSRNCTTVVDTCTLETKRRCLEGNGEIEGCSQYGVSTSFSTFKMPVEKRDTSLTNEPELPARE